MAYNNGDESIDIYAYNPTQEAEIPMNQPQPFAAPTAVYPKKSGGGFGKFLLIGCGIFLLLAIVLGIVFSLTWRKGVAYMVRQVMTQVMEDVELSDEEKAAIQTRVERIVTAFEQKKLNLSDLERLQPIFEKEKTGKILMVASFSFMIRSSHNVQAEDREIFRVELSRLVRGLEEGTIAPREFDELVKKDLDGLLKNPGSDDKKELDPAKVHEYIPKLAQYLSDKGIPEGEYKYDVGKLFDEVIDRLLNGTAEAE